MEPVKPVVSVRARSFHVRVLNATGFLLEKAGFPLVRFDEEELLDEARQQTGLSDFGDPGFHEALGRLLRSFREEARLSYVDAVGERAGLVAHLKKRLYIHRDITRFPEILETPPQAPLFILGLPRSGTTLLHSLLTQDRSSRWLRSWEVEEPWPDRSATDETDPRALKFQASLELRQKKNSAILVMHELDAPGECERLFVSAFLSSGEHAVGLDIPSYARWLDELPWQEWVAPYVYYRRQLQRMMWYRPGGGGHWVLRSPQHMSCLEAVFSAFPDARMVHIHRDPKSSVASACSFGSAIRLRRMGRVDRRQIGAFVANRMAVRVERAMTSREHLPASSFCDVKYRDLVKDPIGSVLRIYESFGMQLDPGMEDRMKAWLAENPQHKRGVHRYALEDFGLSEAKIEHLFSSYYEQYGPQAA